jgi:microcystin-dependent protein
MPGHSHSLSVSIQNNVEIWGSSEANGILKQGDRSEKEGSPSGGDKPHNNVHPVIIAHVWIREA